MKTFKKIFGLSVFLFATLLLVSCAKAKYKVTFDSQGGSPVSAVTVESGKTVAAPSNPTKSKCLFAGWFLAAGDSDAFNFDTPITSDLTLYAHWEDDMESLRYYRFNDHRQSAASQLVVAGANDLVTAPVNPTRTGYRFGGWFKTKRGLTWNETAPVNFSEKAPVGGLDLYAYWEPINSVTQNWTDDETYFQSLSSSTPLTFNPLKYQWADENTLIGYMSTAAISQEVDWKRAVKEGIAEYPGDFSKIKSETNPSGIYDIDLLKSAYVLVGAAGFPKNSDGDDLVQEDGSWDPDAASKFLDYTWTIEIRKDLKFQNGTPITAHDYVYSLKQYVDPIQNNSRGQSLVPTEDRRNGYRLNNLRKYALGKISNFDDVGIKAIDNYTLEFKFETSFQNDAETKTFQAAAVSPHTVIGLMNYVKLLHPATYEASLDEARENSDYGTPKRPFVSYGGYLIKTWDENQKLVLNKNYDYVLKQTINYKAISFQYTANVEENYQLFKAGKLSQYNLTGDYVSEFAGQNNKMSYSGYPFSLDLNVTDSFNSDRKAQNIIKDVDFRKAFLLGFDRKGFTSTAYAPNQPSLLIWPYEGKQFEGDTIWYSESPEHLAVLEAMGLNTSLGGYDPVKAYQHFDRAWVKNGSVKVTIDFPVIDAALNKVYSEFIERHYEQLFNAQGEKIDIVRRFLAQDPYFATVDNRNFDLAMDSTGWGFADPTFVYMPLKGIYYNWLFGAEDGGMNEIAGFVNSKGENLADAMPFEPIDMRATLEYLQATKESELWNETTSNGTTLELYNILVATGGYFDQSLETLFYYLVSDSFIWSVINEPYSGAVSDLTRITAAFEYAILDYVTLIPIASRTAIVSYASNVKFEWPEYSYVFGWGAFRYRYLSTDPDFK